MPMQQLSDLTRRLAAAAARVDAADLTTLGTLHTCLAEINRCVTESAGALGSSPPVEFAGLQACVADGEKLVEKIVLQQVDDATAALEQVNRTVGALQSMLDRAPDGAAASAREAYGPGHVA